jgi:hypothetical protein
MHNPGMSGSGALLKQEGSVAVGVTDYTQMAKRNRRRCAQMNNPPEPLYTYIAPSDRAVISIDGVEYRSRRSARFGFVWDLPCRWANEHFNAGHQIPIGKKGDYIVMQLIQVKEEPGTW